MFDGNEDIEEITNVLERVALIEGYSNTVVGNFTKVDSASKGLFVDDGSGNSVETNGETVEEGFVDDFVAKLLGSGFDDSSEPVDLLSNLAKSFGPVVDGVHGCDVGEECLSGANVAGGLFSTNVSTKMKIESDSLFSYNLGK